MPFKHDVGYVDGGAYCQEDVTVSETEARCQGNHIFIQRYNCLTACVIVCLLFLSGTGMQVTIAYSGTRVKGAAPNIICFTFQGAFQHSKGGVAVWIILEATFPSSGDDTFMVCYTLMVQPFKNLL